MSKIDLEKIWEEHTKAEFELHDVDATMATMANEPHLINIPTLMGGAGKQAVRDFYTKYFITQLPKDIRIELISRTVGTNRIVDELILSFTHNTQLDFMLPNIPPTGKYIELPHVVIITFEGDKVLSEHIYWDQACVLEQIGLLDARELPVVGKQAAVKLRSQSQEGGY